MIPVTATDLISYFGITLSVFLSILVLQKGKKTFADWLLFAWFIVVGLHCVYFYLSFHHLYDHQVFVQAVGNSLPVVHVAIIFLYTKSLITGHLSFRVLVLHLVPFLSYTLIYAVLFGDKMISSSGFSIQFYNHSPSWAYGLPPLLIFVNAFYIMLLFDNLKKHQRLLESQYSNELHLTLNWIRYWVYSFVISAVLIILVILASDLKRIPIEMSFFVTGVSMCAQLFIVGQYGLKQSIILTAQKIDSNDEEKTIDTKYAKSGLQKEKLQQLIVELTELMKREKPYLDSDLTLPKLAEKLDLPTYQLSQVINEGFNLNFFDYVNTYRVEEYKKRLVDEKHAHLSLLGLAIDCGFKSKSSFNKTFKRLIRMTPSAYKKSLK